MQPTGLRVMWRWPSHGLEGGPLCSDVRLRGIERGAVPVLGLRIPWMTSASRAEIGSPDGYGASWQSVRPSDGGAAPGGYGDEGHRQACSAWNWRHAAHGSGDPCRLAGNDGGPAPLSIDNEWAWSTISSGIQWWRKHPVNIGGSKP
jgi:hypothetical protein